MYVIYLQGVEGIFGVPAWVLPWCHIHMERRHVPPCVRHCGSFLNRWGGAGTGFLVSDWTIFTYLLIISLAEDSSFGTVFKSLVCPTAVKFPFYFYFFWKNFKKPVLFEQRHRKILSHFTSLSLTIFYIHSMCAYLAPIASNTVPLVLSITLSCRGLAMRKGRI